MVFYDIFSFESLDECAGFVLLNEIPGIILWCAQLILNRLICNAKVQVYFCLLYSATLAILLNEI